MTYTYTYVHYFSDDDEGIKELASAFMKLEVDFLARKPYLSRQCAAALERRLDVLRAAWALLLEPVPKPYEQ